MDQIWRTKEMIALVRAGLSHECNKLIQEVEQGAESGRNGLGGDQSYPVDAGSGTTETVRDYVSSRPGTVERPQPVMEDYDLLLTPFFPQGGDSMTTSR